MSENPYLTSLDRETGQLQWKTELPSISGLGGEYRTPLVIERNGLELIVEWSTSRSQLVLYDAKTGKILCQFDTKWIIPDEAIATPCTYGGILYLADIKSVVAIDIDKLLQGDSPVLWSTDLDGRGPVTSSPVVSQGLLFMISDKGAITCADLKNGKIVWQRKIKGIYFSSPVSIGNIIYFPNSAGMTTVIEASREFSIIAENQLPEGIYSTLAPIDGKIIIRTKNSLWCIR
jgi:outer membrane protein assembly factor BamB